MKALKALYPGIRDGYQLLQDRSEAARVRANTLLASHVGIASSKLTDAATSVKMHSSNLQVECRGLMLACLHHPPSPCSEKGHETSLSQFCKTAASAKGLQTGHAPGLAKHPILDHEWLGYHSVGSLT